MHLLSTIALAVAALPLEAAIGYPPFLYRAIGHPVTWMGALLDRLEVGLNRPGDPPARRRLLGIVALLVLLAASISLAAVFVWIVSFRAIGLVLIVLASTSLIAQRSLYDHVRAVADALDGEGLDSARKAVSMIVGRNTQALDHAGVARAAIESLAENFSDGVVAPTFWLALAGLPGAAAYKASNTADSMIGHLTPRYAAFGWAAARLDDVLNLPASRLAALYIIAAGALTGASYRDAWECVRRDASRHRSPNAGWPEAAMAGALGLKLGGPRIYGDEIVDDAFMGDGRREATAADIRAALRLYQSASIMQWLVLAALYLLIARW